MHILHGPKTGQKLEVILSNPSPQVYRAGEAKGPEGQKAGAQAPSPALHPATALNFAAFCDHIQWFQ